METKKHLNARIRILITLLACNVTVLFARDDWGKMSDIEDRGVWTGSYVFLIIFIVLVIVGAINSNKGKKK